MSDGQVHSRFGGSKATRFMNCAGSTTLEALVAENIKDEGSAFSRGGTLAHDFAAWCLYHRVRDCTPHVGDDIDERCGRPSKGNLVTREIADAVQFWLDAVWDEYDRTDDAVLLVESAFTMPSEAAPGQSFGRADAVIYHRSIGRLWVGDYKHGVGYGVAVEDNGQDKFYVTGQAFAHTDWPLREVVCAIVQPRDWRNNYFEDSPGEVREWSMPPEQILDFHQEIEQAIVACLQAEATFIGAVDGAWGKRFLKAGSWCDWCPAAGGLCPARLEQAEHELKEVLGFGLLDIDDLGVAALPNPKDLQPERIARLLNALDMLKPYHKQVFDFASGLVGANITLDGWKLADKVGRAKWIEQDEEIAAYLEVMHGIPAEDTLKLNIVTITDAERLLKQQFHRDPKGFAAAKDELRLKFTIKDSSGVTLVRADNRREAVNIAAVATAGLSGL